MIFPVAADYDRVDIYQVFRFSNLARRQPEILYQQERPSKINTYGTDCATKSPLYAKIREPAQQYLQNRFGTDDGSPGSSNNHQPA
jgi:hypothetical protein